MLLHFFFIIAPSVGAGVFLNWKYLKNKWHSLQSKWIFKFKPRLKKAWEWRKRLWENSRKNPAIVLLAIAWVCIAFSVWRFSPDLYELYKELAGQILEEGQTADDYRGIAIRYFGIIAGAGAIIGYIFATGRNIMLDNQNKINDRTRITESIGLAIAQIGAVNGSEPNIEVRLGGLYSLQSIMQDNEERELSIVKILYAYVRENLKRDKTKQPKQVNNGFETYKLPEDIQAALNIISQFSKEQKAQGKKRPRDNELNFSHTDFSDYSLKRMDFRDAIFENANLSGTDLYQANLSGAFLHGANLSGVCAVMVDLSNARFLATNFSGASLHCIFESQMGEKTIAHVNFANAHLSALPLSNKKFINVSFSNTDLENTEFYGADLSEAVNITQEQINLTRGDEKTIPPKGLYIPESWKKPRPTSGSRSIRNPIRKLP